MCGISGIVGMNWERSQLERMASVQHHRGPDDYGIYIGETGLIGLGHNRLSIIDLSSAGHQPMTNHDQSLWIVLNGEIYNYLELRAELPDYPYSSHSDTEVILAAYEKWGEACLDRFIGMFAFLLWDARKQVLFAARDRFGVKPLYYAELPSGALAFSSEIRALHNAGLEEEPDSVTWATYLTFRIYEHRERTFWHGVKSLPAGHKLVWMNGRYTIGEWYNLAEQIDVGENKIQSEQSVMEEYRALLKESIELRFRSDVPVGINLSGGVDSSILLGLVHAVQGHESDVNVYTFVTGDKHYDELPWVKQMLARTHHPHKICQLSPGEIPDLAVKVQWHQYEPFGGLPTLAYSKLHQRAKHDGVIVLLDGQGLDEQWAGYDHYAHCLADQHPVDSWAIADPNPSNAESSVNSKTLVPEFTELAEPFMPPSCFPDSLRNTQFRDARYTKIPRALRFNDRISMMYSTELREPFLDHRLFELALSQPAERKIRNGTHKWLLRQMVADLLPHGVREAPKRTVQTPQREWLRGPLKNWADDCIEAALSVYGGSWLDADSVRREWQAYQVKGADNSFYIWQWVNLGLMSC